MVFEIEDGIQIEDDILIRVRHYLSTDIRYPVLRLMLSPLMIFTNFYKVPASFIDFSENVVVDTENFYIELEMEFKTQEASSAYMNLEAISKNNKFFGTQHNLDYNTDDKNTGETAIYTIVDDNDEQEEKQQVETLEKQHKQKIDQLLENFEEVNKESNEELKASLNYEIVDEVVEESDEDDDYFTNLESQAD